MKYEIETVHDEAEYLVRVGENVFVQQTISKADFDNRFGNELAEKSADILGKDHIHAMVYPICFNKKNFFKGTIFPEQPKKKGAKKKND